ncbi:MAG: hypothetical protein V4671_22905, partial [Armatimonadota bacterium]
MPQNSRLSLSSLRKRAGFVTMTVLLIALICFVGAIAMVSGSLMQVQSSARSQDRMTGLLLAEAGVDDAVTQASSDIAFTGRTATVYEDPPTNSKKFGTFTTTITEISGDKRKITSIGTNTNGTTRQVVAIITAGEQALGGAAIMSKGSVDITGNADVNSVPTPNLGISHVYANTDIKMKGSSTVDGILMAAGIVFGGSGSKGTVENGTPVLYPDTVTTNKWRLDWITEAKAGGTMGAVNKNDKITAPMFINGGINLGSKDKVELKGPGSIYVNGDIDLTAQTELLNGATLIVAGTFTQTGQSVYKVKTGTATPSTPTPTMVVYGSGYGATSDVIKLTGGSLADQQGIVYAVNGSIKVAGNSMFVGSLVAGGTGAQISVHG